MRPAASRACSPLLGPLLGLLGLLAACTRPEPPSRADARVLEEVLAADHALEAALRDADALARSDEKKAAELLDTRAIPLADDVVRRASAAPVTSPWGSERKTELVALARSRREELPRYAKALREGDLKTKLEAVEKQLDLQKRALDSAARISQVPP
jgi:hypothetical protein